MYSQCLQYLEYITLFYDYICLLECCFCIMRAIFLFFLTFFISYLFLSNLQVLSQHRKLELPYLDLWLHYKKHTLHCFSKVFPVLVQQCAQNYIQDKVFDQSDWQKTILKFAIEVFLQYIAETMQAGHFLWIKVAEGVCCWEE